MKIFISYQHKSIDFVKKMALKLETNGHSCFYAERNIGFGSYAAEITKAVDECDIFIVILTEDAYKSVGVANELELATNKLAQLKPVLIIPVKLTESDLPDLFRYYVQSHNWIIGFNKSDDDILDLIVNKIGQGISGIKSEFKPNVDRTFKLFDNKSINSYLSFMSNNPDEDYRLEQEAIALYPFEKKIYDKIFLGKEKLNILDCHVLHPKSALERLNREETNKYIGLCYDKVTVDNANNAFGNPYTKFYNLNLLDDDFDEKMMQIMEDNEINSFDIVNISNGVMDTNKSFKLLKKAKKYLKEDGYMYIRDLDDYSTYGYPDEDGYISKFINILRDDPLAGNRDSARVIYRDLVRCHVKEITIEQQGINTINMSYKDKMRMFLAYFSYAKREFKALLEKESNNHKFKENIKFIEENMDDIEELFESDEFFFNVGINIYIAKF